jgi:beta-amylase
LTRPSSNTSPNTGLTLLFYTHRAGSEAGHIEWGGAGPHDAGGYNNLPHETGFFTAHEGSWDSEYGQFFLSWYAGELVEHGDRMLRCARNVFERDDDATGLNISEGIGEGISEGNSSTGTFSKKGKKAAVGTFVTTVGTADTQNTEKKHVPALAIKCAGVHWWYNSRSHAAELTAGYFNTRSGDRAPERDGYEPIVAICGVHGARLNFTCAEMRDVEHPFFSRCGPEGLLRQIRAAAARYGVKVAGENALCRFDQDAYEKIITNCRGEGEDAALWATGTLLPPMASFTFLRLSKELFEDDNFRSFVRFVARMANETGTALVDEAHAVQADEVFKVRVSNHHVPKTDCPYSYQKGLLPLTVCPYIAINETDTLLFKSLFSEETDADGNSDTLRPGGLRDIRDETSSGYVTTGSTETERG